MSEALRLADAIDPNGTCLNNWRDLQDAAAELRRLHEELTESEKWRDRDEFRAANAERERDIAEAQRDALRVDAERYRWLRDTLHSAVGGGIEVNDLRLVYEEPEPGEEVRVYWYPVTPVGFNEAHGKTLDDAVDAAIKQAEGETE